MSDRSSDDPSFGRAFTPHIFEAWTAREILNTRAPVTETPKRLFLV